LLGGLCVAGRCPDKAETSATLVGLPFQIASSSQRDDHDRVLEELKINVIARWQGCDGI
jgi:hypothetical protein